MLTLHGPLSHPAPYYVWTAESHIVIDSLEELHVIFCDVLSLSLLSLFREDASFRRATDAGVDSLSWCFNMSVLLEPRCSWDCINKPTGVWVEHVSFGSYTCQDIIHHTSAAVPLFSRGFQRIALVVKVICLFFFFPFFFSYFPA